VCDEDPGKRLPRLAYAIWTSSVAPEDADRLGALLSGGGNGYRAYTDFDKWLASGAEVLVVRGSEGRGTDSSGAAPRLDAKRAAVLRSSKVLGIGWQAADMFGALGLELNTGIFSSPESRAQPNLLLQVSSPELADGRKEIAAFAKRSQGEATRSWHLGGLAIPTWSFRTEHVSVIARWSAEPSLAAIAQQGGYVLVGPASDVSGWSKDLKKTVQGLARGLRRRPDETLRLPDWPLTEPGRLEFDLAPDGDTAHASGRVFHFKFKVPTLLVVDFELLKGGEAGVFFSGEKSEQDMVQENSGAQARLGVIVPIGRASIRANGDRYWRLEFWNFGPGGARVRAHVKCVPYGTVTLLDGKLRVSMRSPPGDEKTIARVVELFLDEDPGVRREARAALLIIGSPALGALERAVEKAADAEDFKEAARLSILVDEIRQRSSK
jgi:hypothetical protein